VAERQKRPAKAYWLISQPDHARLSGELAANFISSEFPPVEPAVAQAIGAHDSGWAVFPAEASMAAAPMTNGYGKPLAFIEFGPEQFLRAWSGSIDRAEGICATGGIIVSRHFCELGNFRLANGVTGSDRECITAFIQKEDARQERLLQACPHAGQELDTLLEVLKFCDLLSLFLCSGAESEAEFPQEIASRKVRGRLEEDKTYHFDPSPFQHGSESRTVRLAVAARRFPFDGDARCTKLSFALR
jgi:hypothetical protein